MTDRDKKYISEYMYRMFLHIMGSLDAERLSDALQDDVVKDIEETADSDNWNWSDVDIAMTRVLLKRVTGENF